jgi:hypothetical protein
MEHSTYIEFKTHNNQPKTRKIFVDTLMAPCLSLVSVVLELYQPQTLSAPQK